jgi:hypothetical protein
LIKLIGILPNGFEYLRDVGSKLYQILNAESFLLGDDLLLFVEGLNLIQFVHFLEGETVVGRLLGRGHFLCL